MPLPGKYFFGPLNDKPLSNFENIYIPTSGKIVKAFPYLSMSAPLFQCP